MSDIPHLRTDASQVFLHLFAKYRFVDGISIPLFPTGKKELLAQRRKCTFALLFAHSTDGQIELAGRPKKCKSRKGNMFQELV